MRGYYSGERVRNADRLAEELGIPGIILMENAGRGAAELIIERCPSAEKFTILCGPGNNGGDGFVVARRLALLGRKPFVIMTRKNPEEYTGDAAVAAKAASSCVPMAYSKDMSDEDIKATVSGSDILVDALLGTGSKGVPRGEAERLIKISSGAAHIISLDIPSGIDADMGEIPGVAVKAELTITFLAAKTGMGITPASLYCGDIKVTDIGVYSDIVLHGRPDLVGHSSPDIARMSPAVPKDVYKGARGSLIVVGGSHNFRGAPLLAALGALRSGCGLVFLAVPFFMAAEAAAFLPEAILLPLPDDGSFIRANLFTDAISPYIDKCDAMVLGPGLGRSPDTEALTALLCNTWDKPLLLDADALHNFKNVEHNIKKHLDNALITPHTGEAAYLLGTDSAEVSGHRLASCAALAKKFGTALLKGPNTLIFSGDEKRVIEIGGPELAIPGSGDVLSGAIGTFLAGGMNQIDAATLGALVHAAAGARIGKTSGILARELADNITAGDARNAL